MALSDIDKSRCNRYSRQFDQIFDKGYHYRRNSGDRWLELLRLRCRGSALQLKYQIVDGEKLSVYVKNFNGHREAIGSDAWKCNEPAKYPAIRKPDNRSSSRAKTAFALFAFVAVMFYFRRKFIHSIAPSSIYVLENLVRYKEVAGYNVVLTS